jgi:hypothetical protein
MPSIVARTMTIRTMSPACQKLLVGVFRTFIVKCGYKKRYQRKFEDTPQDWKLLYIRKRRNGGWRQNTRNDSPIVEQMKSGAALE